MTVMSEPPGWNLDSGVWLRVDTPAQAAAVRRSAERLAERLGIPARRIARLAVAAGAVVEHAGRGAVLVRAVRGEYEAGVELIAAGRGPGTAGDVAAIAGAADWYDRYSLPGRGTVLALQVWASTAPEPGWAGGVVRPIPGESVSGDGFAGREVDGRRQLLLSDGLGHGSPAAHATEQAIRAFREAPAGGPADVVAHLHAALGHSRGAMLAVAEPDPAAGLVRFCGLGDITGVVAGADGTHRRMAGLPGIAGQRASRITETAHPLAAGDAVILHSDGVDGRWSTADYPGLTARSPQVIAATVLRDAGLARDDAGVAVARPGIEPGPARPAPARR